MLIQLKKQNKLIIKINLILKNLTVRVKNQVKNDGDNGNDDFNIFIGFNIIIKNTIYIFPLNIILFK